ncbi:MAG: hypothetical protein AAF340_15035 [Pseudomonadota bacterium]
MVERTRSTLIEGDFDDYADSFTYPHVIITTEKTIKIEDLDDMKRLYDNIRVSYEKMGLTHASRQCLAAAFGVNGILQVTHVNHLMSGTRRLNEPIPVYSNLVEGVDGNWRIFKAEYAIDKKLPFGAALEVGQNSNPLRFIENAKN